MRTESSPLRHAMNALRHHSFATFAAGRRLPRLAGVGILTLMLAAAAHAASYTVSNKNDSGTGSLRAAITSVNGDSSADTITFAPAVTGTINLQTPLPSITNSVTITGPGAGKLTISGSGIGAGAAGPMITVNTGVTVTLSGLTLAENTNGGGDGGAINTAGTLTISGCEITNNSALDGGGIYASGGTLTVLDSSFSGNISTASGGAIAATGNAKAMVTNSSFSANQASGDNGGAIENGGTLTIVNSTISLNLAPVGSGGGVDNAGTLTLGNAIVAGNSASTSSDVNGTYTDNGGNQVNESASTINLAPLNNYGGVLQTMLPLPGSPAICGGLAANASGASLTTDERGFSFGKAAYCTGSQVDAGAVQTDYTSIQFTNANTTYGYAGLTGHAVATPAPPNVSVTENGQNIGGVPVTLTEGSGTATGVGPVTTIAGTGATFSSLTVGTADASDTLSASLQPTSSAPPFTSSVGLVIEQPMTLAGSLPGATVGTLYTQPLVSSGGTSPFTDKVNSGSLPAGVTFGSDGSLSGTPTTANSNDSFSLTVTDNYGFTATGSYTVAVAKGTASLSFSGTSQVYTGSSLPVTVTTTPSGLTVGITYTGISPTVYGPSSTAPKNVGTYTVDATVNGTDENNWTGSSSTTLTITNGSVNIQLNNLNQTFGSTVPVTATTTPGGITVDITYTGISPTVYPTSSTPPTNAGSYTVSATVDATADPNYSGSQTGTLTINPEPVTFTLGNLSQTFGSTGAVTVTNASQSGLTYDLTYSSSSYPSSATPPTNAGTYTVVARVDPTADPNFTGSQNGALTIAQQKVTIALSSNLSQTFGSVTPVTASTTPSGITVDVTYSGSGYGPSATEPINAGTYTVTASVDPSQTNYTGTISSQLQINKATATVTLVPSSLIQVYTGSPLAVSVTTTPTVQAVVITYNGSTNQPVNAGAYSVIATVNDPNYQGSANAQMVIEDFTLSDSFSGTASVTQGFATGSGVSGVNADPFTPQAITMTPAAVGYTPNLTLTCTVSAATAPSSPTVPACLLNDTAAMITGNGLTPATVTINAAGATPGFYTVAVAASDPATGLTRTSSFTVAVRSASTALTLQSGATTGNTATVDFVLPANVGLSGLNCTSIAGPTLTAPVTPIALGVACTLNPTSIASATSIQEAPVTVSVNTGATMTTAQLGERSSYLAAGVLGIPLLGLFGLLAGGRKSAAAMALRVFLIVGVVFGAMQLTGCGGSFTRTTTASGSTPPGSYDVLVQGTGSDNQTYQAVVVLNVTR